MSASLANPQERKNSVLMYKLSSAKLY